MYVDQQHVATGHLDDGFYLVENDTIGTQVFRVKMQTEPPIDGYAPKAQRNRMRWYGQQVIALGKTPQARTFSEWCVITDDGRLPTVFGLPMVSGDEMRQRGTPDEFAEALVASRAAALEGRLYCLVSQRVRLLDTTFYRALMLATHALLDSSEQQEQAGRMYARCFGRCRVCNRKLTHPDSVETGIGPECAGTRAHQEITAQDE